MYEFSFFNNILLSLFDVSNVFHASMLVKKHFWTSKKLNKIWL